VLLSSRWDARETHAVCADQLIDVLDLLIAQIDKDLLNLSVNLLEYGAGDQNAARLRHLLEARRDVDAITMNVISVYDHVAKIDADTKDDHTLVRHLGVTHCHALLKCDSAFDGVDRACELDEQAIAHHLHQPSVMLGNRRVNQFGTMGSQRTVCSNLIHAHESAVAGHVRAQDRGEPAALVLPCHRSLPGWCC
jgi:hypothetical protein